MPTKSFTKTVQLSLETREDKNDRVRECIDEWQTMLARAGDLMPSIPRHRWGDTTATWVNRLAKKEFPTDEVSIMADDRSQAFYKASEAYGSWKERGCPGDRPQFDGDGSFMRLRGRHLIVADNNRGFGVKIKLQPRNPEWFHVRTGEYETEILSSVVDGEMESGSGELFLDDGELSLNLTVSTDVEVDAPGDVDRYVGVDLGENVVACAAVIDDNGRVEGVEMERGAEFRHHRERLDARKAHFQANKNLERVKQLRGERRRYTDQVCHTVSRQIVDLAVEHCPALIVLEDLTDYRETTDDPIHDWPYAEIQEKISYKATERGVPVETVDPALTSQTCRKCGHAHPMNREGDTFRCLDCEYGPVHADVNAACRIAMAGIEEQG